MKRIQQFCAEFRLKKIHHHSRSIVGADYQRDIGVRDIFIPAHSGKVHMAVGQKQGNIPGFLPGDHLQQRFQRFQRMIFRKVNPIFLRQFPVIQKIHGNRQLLVGGDSVYAAVHRGPLPELFIHRLIGFRAEIFHIGSQFQPVPRQRICQIIFRPGKGDVKLSVGIHKGVKPGLIIVPSDLVIADRESIPRQQQSVQRLLHAG